LKLCPAHAGAVPLLLPLEPELLAPELLAPELLEPELPGEPELLAEPELPLDEDPWRAMTWVPLSQPSATRAIAASAATLVEIGAVQRFLSCIVRPRVVLRSLELARARSAPPKTEAGPRRTGSRRVAMPPPSLRLRAGPSP
jgi:hypothetical protein